MNNEWMNNTIIGQTNGQMIQMVKKNIGTPKIHKESSKNILINCITMPETSC